MTDDIIKLYENAGIKKIELDYPDNFEPFYPEFNAEKQIELIKWVCTNKEIRISGHRKGNLYWMSTNVDNKEQESTFEEALAKLVNNIWQDLTEEEKETVKEILNG